MTTLRTLGEMDSRFAELNDKINEAGKLTPKLTIEMKKLRDEIGNEGAAIKALNNNAKEMVKQRTDAALLVSKSGALSGIVTDNDMTRRVVAASVDVETSVSDVMTKDPQCVSADDSGMDALLMMIKNHFRHLPVLDNNSQIVGVLDIAKCMFDVICI